MALDLKALGLDLGATRLGLRLDLGWTRVIASGPAIVPGRGFDVGFTQDSHLVPASLALAWHLAPAASVRPFILAGLGTVWTQTHFTAFSAPVSDRAFGLLGVFGAGLGFQAGPGELGLEVLVDVAGVDLGRWARSARPPSPASAPTPAMPCASSLQGSTLMSSTVRRRLIPSPSSPPWQWPARAASRRTPPRPRPRAWTR